MNIFEYNISRNYLLLCNIVFSNVVFVHNLCTDLSLNIKQLSPVKEAGDVLVPVSTDMFQGQLERRTQLAHDIHCM